MTEVAPERIEEALATVALAIRMHERYPTSMQENAQVALDSLAAALREAQAEIERLRKKLAWLLRTIDAPADEAKR